MDHELKDAVLLSLLRHRRLDPAARVRWSVAMRNRLADLWERCVSDDTDGPWPLADDPQAARARAQAWVDALNAQRVCHVNAQRVCHLVFPRLGQTRGDRRGPGADGEREAATGRSPDVRDVADQFDWEAAEARWLNCHRKGCRYSGFWSENRIGCLDRQRAGFCPAQPGRDSGPQPGRDAGVGPRRAEEGPGGGDGGVVTCPFCDPSRWFPCKAELPVGFLCSRQRGHQGPHVACGNLTHKLAIWPQEEER